MIVVFIVNQRSLLLHLLPDTSTLSIRTDILSSFGNRRIRLTVELEIITSSGDTLTIIQNSNTTQGTITPTCHQEEESLRTNLSLLSPNQNQSKNNSGILSISPQVTTPTLYTTSPAQAELQHTWVIQQERRLRAIEHIYALDHRRQELPRDTRPDKEEIIADLEREEEAIEQAIDEYLYELRANNLEAELGERHPSPTLSEELRYTREFSDLAEAHLREGSDGVPDELDKDYWESHSARSH